MENFTTFFKSAILLLFISCANAQTQQCTCSSEPPNCPLVDITTSSSLTTSSKNDTTTFLSFSTPSAGYECCQEGSKLQCCNGAQHCVPGCEGELKDNIFQCRSNIESRKCYLNQSVPGSVTCSLEPNVPTSARTPTTTITSQTEEKSLQEVKAIVATLLALFIVVVVGAVILFFFMLRKRNEKAERLGNKTNLNDNPMFPVGQMNEYSHNDQPMTNQNSASARPNNNSGQGCIDQNNEQPDDDTAAYVGDSGEDNYIEPIPNPEPSRQSYEEHPYAKMTG